jgi:hypothetical protein
MVGAGVGLLAVGDCAKRGVAKQNVATIESCLTTECLPRAPLLDTPTRRLRAQVPVVISSACVLRLQLAQENGPSFPRVQICAAGFTCTGVIVSSAKEPQQLGKSLTSSETGSSLGTSRCVCAGTGLGLWCWGGHQTTSRPGTGANCHSHTRTVGGIVLPLAQD